MRLATRLVFGFAVVLFCPLFATSAFAQSNGALPVDQIKYAKNIVEYANANNVCSSAYIQNGSLLADCAADVLALANLINAWDQNWVAGTLTVAYDAAVETQLSNYETALQNILSASGFNSAAATSSATASIASTNASPAYHILADRPMDAGDTAYCATCGTGAAATEYACLAGIELPPAAFACIVGVALAYINCGWDRCFNPPKPPTPPVCTPSKP